ncbi:MAG: hypothetical protein JNK50_00175 [Bacteroidia bacterium]|nr:hypothetical protein [Bacteroidia bacterium]
MGTWDTSLKGNDTFLDIYQNFFDLYNQGQEPADISAQIKNDFADYFTDHEDKYNSLFGLALAQWETKSLDPNVLNQVKEIIASGQDLELWKELGGNDKDLKKRKVVLDKFLLQISTDREKPKRRIKAKFDFELKEIVHAVSPDNKKEFKIHEEFENKKYIHTSGLMGFFSGGGSGVLYFKEQGKFINAKWLDSQTLEVTHDKDMVFTKQENSSYFCGDDVKVIYKTADM